MDQVLLAREKFQQALPSAKLNWLLCVVKDLDINCAHVSRATVTIYFTRNSSYRVLPTLDFVVPQNISKW